MRNLKVLGLALVAVLALNALAASTASATQKKLTAVGGAAQHLTGTDIGLADTYTVAGNSITCEGETYTATLPAGTGVTEITAVPTYGNECKTVGAAFNNVTVTVNGCAFVFKNQTNIKTDEDEVDVYIECPQGPPVKTIEIHHYSQPANHTNGVSSCTDTVGTQTATGNLIATSDTAKEDIELHGQVGVHLQTHGSCSFGFTLSVEAKFDASATIDTTAGGARIHIG